MENGLKQNYTVRRARAQMPPTRTATAALKGRATRPVARSRRHRSLPYKNHEKMNVAAVAVAAVVVPVPVLVPSMYRDL